MENNTPLQVNLEFGPFFNYGEMYHVSFDYSSDEQKNKMSEFFKYVLPTYGMNGSRHLKDGKEAIMPYLVDEKGHQIYSGNIYGGTSIPEDLLIAFLKRFIEVDKANVKIGNILVTGQIEDELLSVIVQSIGKKMNKGFNK